MAIIVQARTMPIFKWTWIVCKTAHTWRRPIRICQGAKVSYAIIGTAYTTINMQKRPGTIAIVMHVPTLKYAIYIIYGVMATSAFIPGHTIITNLLPRIVTP